MIARDQIVRWKGKLWRVMDVITKEKVDLWCNEEDAFAPADELEYIGDDTLTTFASGYTLGSLPETKKKAPKKRDSISTGSLIKDEVTRLRADEKPAPATAKPTGRKSVLDEDTGFVPKAKGERKGTW